MNQRIRELRVSLGMSQKRFGEKLDVSGSAISRLESGSLPLTNRMSKAICREFHVSESWLAGGEGPMFAQDEEDIASLIARELKGKSDFARHVVLSFARLEDADWDRLERFIDRLAAKGEATYTEKNP